MGKISIVGSTTYDNIMSSSSDFKDFFTSYIDEDSKTVHSIDDLQKETGGSGLNIAYNLALLGEKSELLTTIGNDFSFSDFIKENVDLTKVYRSKDKLTSRSYIITDKKNTKFRSYFLGASGEGKKLNLSVSDDIDYSIVSKFDIQTMISALKKYKKAGVKTIFSPGFQIKNMTKSELESCFECSDILVVNQSGYDKIKTKSEKTDEKMINLFDFIIITYGINGSKIFDSNYHMHEIPGVQNHEFVDAVGVGDTYKAGLIKGLNSGYDIETSAKLAAVLASVSTGSLGAHSHKINWSILEKLYKDTYGEEIKK